MRLTPIRETGTERDFDVVRTMRYRSELFGRPFSAALQAIMRGPSDWSPGERELFAAFVSAQNHCVFWTDSHGAVASFALGDELVAAILADHRTAPIEPGLRATLDLLQKATLTPAAVTPTDVDAVRAAGVSDDAIEDALGVCFGFNLIDRVADALEFDCPPAEVHKAYAGTFLAEGYGNET